MFEAHGVWNSRMYASLSDRINVGRLEAFRRYAQKRKKGSLIDFVSSDRPFQVDADAAYAEAWALTIYLVENEPRKYQQYLQRTAARSAFVKLTTPERLQEFIDVFGSDVAMLETRMLRYVSTLK